MFVGPNFKSQVERKGFNVMPKGEGSPTISKTKLEKAYDEMYSKHSKVPAMDKMLQRVPDKKISLTRSAKLAMLELQALCQTKRGINQ